MTGLLRRAVCKARGHLTAYVIEWVPIGSTGRVHEGRRRWQCRRCGQRLPNPREHVDGAAYHLDRQQSTLDLLDLLPPRTRTQDPKGPTP